MHKLAMYLLLLLFVGGVHSIYAQQDSISTDSSYTISDDFSLSAFPLVFFLPETGLAFGGAGIMVFNLGEERAWRKSQLQLGVAYTLKNQLLIFMPFELYYKDKYKAFGELGYYRYFYNYFGTGINSQLENLEFYDANFPRFLGNFSRRVTPSILAGVQYRFDYFDIPRTDSLLTFQNPTGIEGGVISTIGLALSYDSRDDVFYPSEGVLIDFTIENGGSYTGANYPYSLIQIDAKYYKTLAKNHILATNLFTGTTIGDSPFFAWYFIASGKRLRGYDDRRFIDRNALIMQVEYRYPIYKRFSGVAFAATGTVGAEYQDVFNNPYKLGYGLGLRYQLSKKQKSNVRVDVANSAEGTQFYITIGEAF